MMLHKRPCKVARHDGANWVIEELQEYMWTTNDGKQELSSWLKSIRQAIDFAIDREMEKK